MRQVFLGTPWVHASADRELIRFFNSCGRWQRLPAGGCIFNGGNTGEVAMILTGLGAYTYQDHRGQKHIFALILPGRLMGDIDCFSGKLVNVTDMALRESEVRIVGRDAFLGFLDANPDIQTSHAHGVIAQHESDMEGMIANFTLPVPKRIAALFASLIHNLQIKPADGFYPVPYNLTAVEIAQIVATARPTVSTILGTWQLRGLSRKNGRQLFVSEKIIEDLPDWTRIGATPGAKIRKRRHVIR